MNDLERLKMANDALSRLFPILDSAKVDPKSKALVARRIYKEAGIELPFEVTDIELYYDMEQIAKSVGIFTQYGDPAVNAVKALLQKIKVENYEERIVWETDGAKQDTVMKYTATVIDKIKIWLKENWYPGKISYNEKNKKVTYYHVFYRYSKQKNGIEYEDNHFGEQLMFELGR